MKNINVYIFNFQKILEGYRFLVYLIEFCLRNQIEWNERLFGINCNRSNGYMCLFNENFIQLLEFCYEYFFILIEEGNRGVEI